MTFSPVSTQHSAAERTTSRLLQLLSAGSGQIKPASKPEDTGLHTDRQVKLEFMGRQMGLGSQAHGGPGVKEEG